MKYDWILFDADETLFSFDAFKGLELMFSRHGVAFNKTDFIEYEKINRPLWVQYQNGEISAAELQQTRFRPWAKKLNTTEQQLNDDFMNAMADICKPLLGAKSLLDSLKGKAKLGIITNGFTALQRIRLERTGFADYFDLLVISEQVGVAKPDRRIFEYSLEKMGNPTPSRVLMVGDNPQSDILGGINAGFDTCWFNHQNQPQPENITPTYQVATLIELEKILE
ncbi:pyrimidine 5'-nucleotidase [Photobacterium leiognathi]|uniref:pyrimidine 5'-nucleotidase n=1 Tax=Photobacterium leiognathi TaxID=553611 RepID=UPI00298273B5|nr:pyrimidine 5'-nucleotidase [Photobacterium leiognathi]